MKVATVEKPTAMATHPDSGVMYVTEQPGRVRLLRNGELEGQPPALDITESVASGGEQGLLGIAFAPDGDHVYLNYTNTDGDTRIVEYAVAGDGTFDQGSRRVLLAVDQPYSNHNGGQLAFGPDGYLYIGLGDGGAGGDPEENAQSLDTLLGKILRIDPQPSGQRPYTIPPDNPFVDRAGARPEIWAYGLRNPWRFSFDPKTGALWIGDVGQDSWEEIDYLPPDSGGGQNYGWDYLEGSHPFEGDAPADVVMPVLEYPLGEGGTCSVTGGYVYRGDAIPALRGHYVYGDFCAGWIRTAPLQDGGELGRPRTLGISVPNLSSFGVDASGELYALSLSGAIYRLAPAS